MFKNKNKKRLIFDRVITPEITSRMVVQPRGVGCRDNRIEAKSADVLGYER